MTTKNKINDGGAAFPSKTYLSFGLTKRELFAAMAMQGILSKPLSEPIPGRSIGEHVARSAVHFADALLAKLNKDEGGGE